MNTYALLPILRIRLQSSSLSCSYTFKELGLVIEPPVVFIRRVVRVWSHWYHRYLLIVVVYLGIIALFSSAVL